MEGAQRTGTQPAEIQRAEIQPNGAPQRDEDWPGPLPARPLREEAGGALALLYGPSVLGAALAGVAADPDVLLECALLLPFAPAALPAMAAASLWPAIGLDGPAGVVAGCMVAAGLTVAMLQLARVVRRASPPSRAFLQVSMASALVIQAWLVGTLFLAFD